MGPGASGHAGRGGRRMVTYWCRRCGALVGRYAGDWDEPRLGLWSLTPQERAHIIVSDLPPARTEVRVLCEDCLPRPPDGEEGLWH
jgi:hypothetical protein